MARTEAVSPENLRIDVSFGRAEERPYTMPPSAYATFAMNDVHSIQGANSQFQVWGQPVKEEVSEPILFSEGQGRLFQDIIFFILSNLSIIFRRNAAGAHHSTKKMRPDAEQDIILKMPTQIGKDVKYLTKYAGQWMPSRIVSPFDE